MTVVALVLAAGRGQRLGSDTPKGLVRAAGRTLLAWSARSLARAPSIDAVLPVVPVGAAADLADAWEGHARLLDSVPGGASRQESVQRGLEAALQQDPETDWVLVHDAARCLVEPVDAERVLAAARPVGAAVPVVVPADTVKVLERERVVETLDRARLGLAQTPQAFRAVLLLEALDKAVRDGFEGTDCSGLIERLGAPVAVCEGRRGNFKVTHAEDLVRAEALLR